MNPNPVDPAPERERRDSGHAGPQINIQNVDSDGSASTCSAGSSFASTSTSKRLEVYLAVVTEGNIRRRDAPVPIGAVDNDSYGRLRAELATFKDSLGLNGRSHRCYFLSGGSQPEVKKPFCHESHLDEAVESYRSGNYDTFEIREYVEPGRESSQISPRQRLQELLLGARVLCQPDDSGWFIPVSKLEEILNETAVEALFRDDADILSLADKKAFLDCVRTEGLKLLAICLLASINPLGETLNSFRENCLLDDRLPYNPQFDPGFISGTDYINICNNQWHIIPFDFKPLNELTKKPLNNKVILPFLKVEKLGEGGFGDVFKAVIHPDYQHLIATKGRHSFAVKKLKKSAAKVGTAGYDREYEALVHISQQSNRHLMQLLTAFQHGDDFYLLFPLAECNLRDCFKENRVKDTRYFNWMLGQFAGLATGIQAIHGDQNTSNLAVPEEGVIGYHHDLKPENILLRRLAREMESSFSAAEMCLGRLQISDFGLGRFRDAATGSISVNIKGTPAYAAPESQSHKSQSRPYDIWSFGCIVLDVLIWLLKGPQGLEEFLVSICMTLQQDGSTGPSSREQKTAEVSSKDGDVPVNSYWTKRGGKYIVNPAVVDHMKDLRTHKVSGVYESTVNELLDVVHDCLQVDSPGRPKAGRLATRMEDIHERFESKFGRDIKY